MDIQLGELSIFLKKYCATNEAREMILLSHDIWQKLREVQNSWKSMRRGIQVFFERMHKLDPDISVELEEVHEIIDFQRRKPRSRAKRS